MKKLLAAVLTGGLTLGVAGVAFAAPDPNGPAHHGLCTAYFNGSDTGRANKHGAGPFVALEEAADDGDADTAPYEDVAAFCGVVFDSEGNVTDPGDVGGNPDFGDPGEANNNRGGKKG